MSRLFFDPLFIIQLAFTVVLLKWSGDAVLRDFGSEN